MSAGKFSFTIEQGATLSFQLTYKDASGNPIDLSQYGGRMQIRPTPGSEEVYLTISSSLQSDGTGLNFSGSNGSTPPASGSIGLYISAITSSLLDFNQAHYDLEIHSGSFVARLLEGQVKLSPNTTR